MTTVLGIFGITAFWLVVALAVAWLIGRMIAVADEQRHTEFTNLAVGRPPVPVHPSALPRQCSAVHDAGRCELDEFHGGDHAHVVVDDQSIVFWNGAAA